MLHAIYKSVQRIVVPAEGLATVAAADNAKRFGNAKKLRAIEEFARSRAAQRLSEIDLAEQEAWCKEMRPRLDAIGLPPESGWGV